uniref:Ankyrin repeat and SOCS box containing 2a, tandem duplicate 1 n=1 Tax=Echeneis naucrates TaxID=173247 RepID=A0A665X690_ECHNA
MFSAAELSEVDLEDYSVYTHFSDEELLQIAVERSLADVYLPPGPSQTSSSSAPAQHPLVTGPEKNQDPDPPPQPPPEVSSSVEPQTILTMFLCKELSPLQDLIRRGDTEALMDLVRQRSSNLTDPDDKGWTALHEAAFYGQINCVRILVRAHPDLVHRCNLRNQTALPLAAEQGNVSCVDFLLKNGANPNIANKDQETPLFTACQHPNTAVVNLLLRFGAQVNRCCRQGLTPLHEACRHGHLQLCKMLLKAGASPGTRNIYGIQPLFTAAQDGHVDVIHLLAQNGADVNGLAADGASPLYEACKNGHVLAAEVLLALGADTNQATNSGLLPLHVAVKNNHIRIVSLLIPVTSGIRIQHSGISPLHIAAERNRDEILELLIQANFDINAELSEERSRMYEDRRKTVLYFSVYNGNLKATEMLLAAGANPNLDIFNPLLIAIRLGWLDMATLLLKYGADVNAQISKQPSSVSSAILLNMECLPMLKLLLDNGCDARPCFDCPYGQNPHPTLPMSHRPIQELQFCEAVSNPSLYQVSGQIISMLLDYVGHVCLCSRLLQVLDGRSDWALIKLKAVPPHALMQLCRLEIRRLVGVRQLKLLQNLPLPALLIRFLRYDIH